jgi:hypothetical protein
MNLPTIFVIALATYDVENNAGPISNSNYIYIYISKDIHKMHGDERMKKEMFEIIYNITTI